MRIPDRPVLLAVVAGIVAAGCLGFTGPDAETGAPSPPETAPVAVVHGPGGQQLDVTMFPGELPDVDQRTVDRGVGYEPPVAVNSQGTAFYAVYSEVADGQLPASLSQVRIVRSRDDGMSWRDVTPRIAGRDSIPLAFDPILHHDPLTDRVFFAYTYAGCMEVLWTDDEGASWDRHPAACASVVNDHETLFTGPPPDGTGSGYPSVTYLCSNQMVVPTAHCATSGDGGRTWTPSRPIPAPVATYGTDEGCQTPANIHGHGEASQADGTAYIPYTYCGTMYVARSQDGGNTWENVVVDGSAGALHHEAAVGTDSRGNVYVTWVGADFQPRLAYSTDGGRTWSDPVDIAAPDATMATPHYAGLAGGDEGRIAVHYLATEAAGETPDQVDADAAWHSYVAFLPDALSEQPVVATTTSDPPGDPIHRGPCDGPGYRCPAMSDYFDLTTDPSTGRVWASFADVCTEECPDGDGTSATRNQASVGVQVAGPLLGARLASASSGDGATPGVDPSDVRTGVLSGR